MPKGGLEIILIVSIRIEDKKRRYLERLKEIITANYQDAEGQESFDLSNLIQTEENFHDEEEAFELEDDEDHQNEVMSRLSVGVELKERLNKRILFPENFRLIFLFVFICFS